MEGRNKSTAYKQAFNEKMYDRLAITIPKGRKATVVEVMKDRGYESINGLVNDLLRGAAGLSEQEWKGKGDMNEQETPD